MTQVKEVFRRYEKKYILEEEAYQIFLKRIQEKMVPDQYGKHTICNIYYDTETYELIRSSIEKPVYKEKLRLRSYGVPQKEDVVFIELKKKFDGIVYKRRVPIRLKDAVGYLDHGEMPDKPCQILKEVDWFLNFYHPHPAVYIAYDRIAMYGKENEDLRVTFDTNIRFREEALNLTKGTWGEPILGEGLHLMELKIPNAMPVWLSRLLTQLSIYPVSYSKYGAYYKNYICQKKEKGGRDCA